MNIRLAIVIGMILGGSNLATAAAASEPRSAAARADAETMFEIGIHSTKVAETREIFGRLSTGTSVRHRSGMPKR